MNPQSRIMSLVETLANVASGMVTAVIVGQIVYPLYGYKVSVADNIWLTSIFTVVSVVRGYVWRRIFERIHRGRAA